MTDGFPKVPFLSDISYAYRPLHYSVTKIVLFPGAPLRPFKFQFTLLLKSIPGVSFFPKIVTSSSAIIETPYPPVSGGLMS